MLLAEHAAWEAARRWRQCVSALGREGLVLVAALVSMAALLGVHTVLQDRLKRVEYATSLAHAAKLQEQEALRRRQNREAPAVRLAAFEARLPAADDIPQVLADLFTLAEEQDVMLERGEFRAVTDESLGLLRYRMSLPVRGRSAHVYRFIVDSLAKHQSLRFESVQFAREQVSSPTLEASIHWSLLTRLPAPAPIPSGSLVSSTASADQDRR